MLQLISNMNKVMSKRLTTIMLSIVILLGLLIRVYDLKGSPPSLYWDEMDVGYQAYSILKTGKDYFGNYPFLTVHSFADYRAPMLIYLTMPFVAFFGLDGISVRLPSALLGGLSILLVFLLVEELYKDRKTALIAALLIAFAPWNFQYSRIGFEAMLMLDFFLGGLFCFFKGLSNSRWFIPAAILFSLNLFTYNTVKLFEPLILFSFAAVYYRKVKLSRNLIIALVLFASLFLLNLYGTIFLKGGQRFSEISVFTDPQTSSQVDFLRQQSRSAYDEKTIPGEEPRILDKLIYNKLTLSLDSIIKNYFQAFSTEFLFVKGDPNLRHSTSYTGEFYRIEILTILAGLIFLILDFKKNPGKTLFLAAWVLISPFASVVTREGGNHATRLFLLFPALTIISALGVKQVLQIFSRRINLVLILLIAIVWMFSVVSLLNFYFGIYTLDSAKDFQYGFNEAVTKALDNKNSYDYVIIDNKGNSALMNYLFVSKYDPNLFQANLPGIKTRFFDFEGDKIDNIIMLKPGSRNWENIFNINLTDKKYLIIISAEQLGEQSPEKVSGIFTKNQKLIDIIRYKSGLPAFYVISSQIPEPI